MFKTFKIKLDYSRNLSTMFVNKVPVPLDPIFSVSEAFRKDTFDKKVNLGVGAYQNEFGKPWVLPVVRKVEKLIVNDNKFDKEYLPISGHEGFINSCIDLIYGNNFKYFENIGGVQSLSGCGACRLGMEYLVKTQNLNTIYLSDPTWAIHLSISEHSGFKNIKKYRYYNEKTKSLDLDGMLEDLNNAPEKSVIILHGAGHNPTGVDPSKDQWDIICNLFSKKKIFPFFDSAYMGFCSGDINTDSYAIRKFGSLGIDMLVALSFSKIMGLYNERIGCLSFLCSDKSMTKLVKDQIKIIIRNSYSNPPAHGARIVHKILSDSQLKEEWFEQLIIMTDRIKLMRKKLYESLIELKTPGDWSHIINQNGLFSFTGLNPEQVQFLTSKHIYMTKNGRINICGLTDFNIEYVSKCISDAVKMK